MKRAQPRRSFSPPGEPPVTVLYVLGSGRSGSTLMERILGGIPGYCNIGEAIDLFPRIAPHDELCGCGVRFSACDFWRAVGKREFGGWSAGQLQELARVQRLVVRQRHLPRLAFPGRGRGAFWVHLEAYLDAQLRLYRAVQAESGASVVVDASKQVPPVFAMRRDRRFDLRVIHLVRDVRGVAYSWAKEVSRPHATSDLDASMARSPVWRTTARWDRMELQARWYSMLEDCATTVRYEDLVSNPRLSVTQALDALGLESSLLDLGHIDGGSVRLPSSHGLGGNPSRFKAGEIELRPDETWRSAMSRRDRLVATTLGLPSLLSCGYVTRGSAH